MLILVTGSVVCLHGAVVTLRMREIGVIERRFHTELAVALMQPGTIAIVPARPSDTWLLQRFTENVPSYRGTSFVGRVFSQPAPAGSLHATMRTDGSLAFPSESRPPR
jgi:hypothetical protein